MGIGTDELDGIEVEGLTALGSKYLVGGSTGRRDEGEMMV